MVTQRLASGAAQPVVPLDVVPLGTRRVVVIHTGLSGVECRDFHLVAPSSSRTNGAHPRDVEEPFEELFGPEPLTRMPQQFESAGADTPIKSDA